MAASIHIAGVLGRNFKMNRTIMNGKVVRNVRNQPYLSLFTRNLAGKRGVLVDC
jgi:hypothetical protein